MNAISEFQIYIGSLDSQLNTELVNENEFKKMVIIPTTRDIHKRLVLGK